MVAAFVLATRGSPRFALVIAVPMLGHLPLPTTTEAPKGGARRRAQAQGRGKLTQERRSAGTATETLPRGHAAASDAACARAAVAASALAQAAAALAQVASAGGHSRRQQALAALRAGSKRWRHVGKRWRREQVLAAQAASADGASSKCSRHGSQVPAMVVTAEGS